MLFPQHKLVAVLCALALSTLPALSQTTPSANGENPPATLSSQSRTAFFGDLHIHTKFSFDAFIFNVRTTPDDAYRYAKGEAIPHPSGYNIRLTGEPLDFIAVTDHAEFLGVLPAMADPNHPLSKVPYAKDMFSTDRAEVISAFNRIVESLGAGTRPPELETLEPVKSAWGEIIEAADRHNEPGKFTALVAYEYTSAPEGRNLHRNVIFSGPKYPETPFASLDSQNPEDLWQWMDGLRDDGIEALAIPHNSNGSDGTMFERTKYDGSAQDKAYAEVRMRNEPLVEITQVKGTSDTHPALSPNDEWADFEIMGTYVGFPILITKYQGGYVRDALLTGIQTKDRAGYNQFEFGFVGASDTHNAGGPIEEERYFSKAGIADGTAESRGSIPPDNAKHWTVSGQGNVFENQFTEWSAAGLTGVWAEENTRDSIYTALRRKETFATSGPRMRVRFFAGAKLPDSLLSDPTAAQVAYETGVPMGSKLELQNLRSSPRFLAWATRDVHGGWLQRLQIVKGWISEGERKEKVFDVACSDGLTPDPKTHRCPDNGATVDLSDCSISEDKGASELKAMWEDPEFDPDAHAFYYVRVLENPSCRWSTWDALRNGTPARPGLQPVIQERAWSSPIWIEPEG